MAELDKPGPQPGTWPYFREWRKWAELSQDALADRMGEQAPTIHKHETHKTKGVKFDYLVRFALAVGCKPWDPLIGPPGVLPQISNLLIDLRPEDQRLILGIIELLKARNS